YGESSLVLNRSAGVEPGLQVNATLVMKANPCSHQQQFPPLRTASANCFGIWDSSGLRIDLRDIIHHRHLTSTTAEGGRRSQTWIPRVRRDRQRRRRERKSMVPRLVALGSLVGIPGRNFLKRRGLAEGCPRSGSFRPPGAVEQHGRRLNAISSRSLERAWLTQHHDEYAGAWVALEGASLVAQGSSYRHLP